MVWFLHIHESEDGRWSCTHGRHTFGTHEDLTEAVHHLGEYAASLGGQAKVLIHRLDGTVQDLGTPGTV